MHGVLNVLLWKPKHLVEKDRTRNNRSINIHTFVELRDKDSVGEQLVNTFKDSSSINFISISVPHGNGIFAISNSDRDSTDFIIRRYILV